MMDHLTHTNGLSPSSSNRTIGLFNATGVGLGAIVGGGILVLSGIAFQATGPSAILAFTFNGLIAFLTALTFAELSTAFPESGGAYTYAKKVLSLRVAFVVGWVLWFAYIVAAVLYALGFAEYFVALAVEIWRNLIGEPPHWLQSRKLVIIFSILAAGGYTLSLIRKVTGGKQWATLGKVIVFIFLILGGAWVLFERSTSSIRSNLIPFFPHGSLGVLGAMGYTFIALQGFEVIAALAGEIRNPSRTLPRAMLISLASALIIYLPFLFIISTVGVFPGQSILTMSTDNPETVIATAVRNYLGTIGYWLVIIAAILSTLSALQANILAASRVALAMARDNTLPSVLAEAHSSRGTPVMALYATALALVVILLMVPNLAAAGASASLIFLISFALAHWTGYLARRRAGNDHLPFRTPWFPFVPMVGGLACLSLALFQAVKVPSAGAITATWLGLGVILYMSLFARRAQTIDALAEATDPNLVKYRGRSPLVLVPIANPANAPSLVAVANALAPPEVGRVMLLAVMQKLSSNGDIKDITRSVSLAQEVTEVALTTSLAAGQAPEVLITVAPNPWNEISRVAQHYRCENLLIGLYKLTEAAASAIDTLSEPIEHLLNEVKCDVSILRAMPGWQLDQANRILIPIGGKGVQHELRARLLGSICRNSPRSLTFLQVLPESVNSAAIEESRRNLQNLAKAESPFTTPTIKVLQSDDVVETIDMQAKENDLIILGLPRIRGKKLIGELAVHIAQRASCPTIMISRHD